MNKRHIIPGIVNGFGHKYSITKSGDVFNETTGRKLKPRPEKNGYLRVNLAGKDYKVHRLVAKMFIPNPHPEIKNQVNHIDGNKRNNEVSNLEWVTNGENGLHAYRTGLKKSPVGTLNSNSKLTPSEVRAIREASGTYRSIGERYGISGTQVSRIKRGVAWSHIQ